MNHAYRQPLNLAQVPRRTVTIAVVSALSSALALALAFVLAVALGLAPAPALAAQGDAASAAILPGPAASSAAAAPDADGDDDEEADPPDVHLRPAHHHEHGNIVSVGHDSTLAGGAIAESVVTIFGSSTSAGEADDVVAVVGDSKASGTVHDSVVSVLGNTYVDGKVDGDAVAVVGGVTLGPHAEIGGDVVAILGTVTRDPAAVVHGAVQSILTGNFGDFTWLRTWITQCLMYARPLAPVAGLGWAWSMAIGLLLLYAGLALMFREAIGRCITTLDAQPGQTLVTAIAATLLTPVLIVLLCITVIGIAAVPFVGLALLGIGLFGKAVSLAWLGGRVIRGFTRGVSSGPLGHPVVAVLVGGAVALGLYLVPVVGFLVYNLLGIMGFGAVVLTLTLGVRARSAMTGAAAHAADPASTASTASASGLSDAGPGVAAMSASVTAALPRAGFWIRMAALLLDVLLVGFGLSLLHDGFHSHLIMLAAYGAIMWKLRGSTVGGIVFDLRVVRSDGRDVDWQTSIVRALSCFLSLAVAGLGFIWIALDSGNQAWHDKIAGTVVVRVPKGAPHG